MSFPSGAYMDIAEVQGKANLLSLVYRKAGGTPWHGMGKEFDEPLTAMQALTLADNDFGFVKEQAVVYLPDGSVRNTAAHLLYREPIPQDNVWREVDIVHGGYEVVQNRDVAAMIDEMKLTERWPLETHGTLGRGERVWFTLNSGMWNVGGLDTEECLLYISMLEDRRAHLQVTISGVRIVCSNTWKGNVRDASMTVTLRHVAGVKDDARFALNLVGKIQDSQANFKAACDGLLATKVESDDVRDLTMNLFPTPTPPRRVRIAGALATDSTLHAAALREVSGDAMHDWELEKLRAHAAREGVTNEFEKIGDEFPAIGGTAWGLFNAVTGYVDHRVVRGRDKAEHMVSTMFGNDADVKSRAFARLLANVE